MILACLLLITGLTISSVAIYYSVLGLAAIFAAKVVPVVIMGTTLEVAKLVVSCWLKAYWNKIPFLLRTYSLIAIFGLMILTSMGIFGFLSKAHVDQALPVGDAVAKVEVLNEKIKFEQDNIDRARADLELINNQIAKYAELGSVTKSVTIRGQQTKERQTLLDVITKGQATIAELRLELAPFSSAVRSAEAEVGPIKYIAAFLYGENLDSKLLEKAVIWVIILIVIVFDPLAIAMLLAAQVSFNWAKESRASCPKITTLDPNSTELAKSQKETPETEILDNVEPRVAVERTEISASKENVREPDDLDHKEDAISLAHSTELLENSDKEPHEKSLIDIVSAEAMKYINSSKSNNYMMKDSKGNTTIWSKIEDQLNSKLPSK